MGFLLSLALSGFSPSGLFTSIRHAQGDDLEVRLAEFPSRLGTIHCPESTHILCDLAFRDSLPDVQVIRRGVLHKSSESGRFVGIGATEVSLTGTSRGIGLSIVVDLVPPHYHFNVSLCLN